MTSEKPRRPQQTEAHEATQELDAYGVWVKSEPQPISEPIPDSSNAFNFLDELAAPDEAPPPSQTARTASLSPEFQDFIHIEIQEKGDGPLIGDRLIPEVSQDQRAEDPIADNDGLCADLAEQIFIEDVLSDPVPQFDAAGLPPWDAGLSEKEYPPLGVPDAPVKPADPPQEGRPLSFLEARDSAGELHILKRIWEEVSLIRQEVSALKALILRREQAAETLDPPQEERAEEQDEKVTITGNELTNIFHNPDHIPKAVTRTQTAPFVPGIEGIPPETGYGAGSTFQESGQPQDAGTAYDGVPHTQEILKEDRKDALADEGPGNGLKHTAGNEAPPPVSPGEDEGDTGVSPDGPAPSPAPGNEDFLLDELCIEHGSVKDIPIAWDPEDEEELDHAFAMIESLTGPEAAEALHKPENPDDREPPDDPPPGGGTYRGSDPGGSPGGAADPQDAGATGEPQPFNLKEELKKVLVFMDQLLEALPEDKIGEFAESRYFDIYKKLFSELGIA
ncbi:MAG: hypothetical protein LBP88_09100 [Treponema sp.]|nr:hypothetical protein [Treponema sp.]